MVDSHALGGLTVERLPDPDALRAVAEEWDRIDRQIAPRTPFTSKDWIIPWWKHFSRRRRMHFHDEFFCHVVRDDDGRLVAVAPLMRTAFPGVGPPLLRMLQFFGADPVLTEIRGLICRPEDQARAVGTLVRHFLARSGEWDVIRWAGLRRPEDVRGALGAPRAFTARESLSDFVLELPETWEDLSLRVSYNTRRKLRKPYELLHRDGFATAFRVVERCDAVSAAMERFLALHAARARARDMVFHADKFVQPHARAFLADYLRGSAERGELRVFELEIGGRVVASRVAFLLGSDLYLYFSGYDPVWRAYSVMTVLMAETFQWAFAHGVERINLSTGRDRSKERWKPHELLFHNGVQVSPTLRAKAAFPLFRAYEAVGAARLMRDRYRQKGAAGE